MNRWAELRNGLLDCHLELMAMNVGFIRSNKKKKKLAAPTGMVSAALLLKNQIPEIVLLLRYRLSLCFEYRYQITALAKVRI